MNEVRNQVHLIGNLGMDPEIRTFKSGRPMARMSLATHEFFKGTDGKRTTNTLWHNLVIWGKTAEIAEKYLRKGSEIAITGKLNYRSFTDKEGKKRYVTEVVVNDLVILGRKKQEVEI